MLKKILRFILRILIIVLLIKSIMDLDSKYRKKTDESEKYHRLFLILGKWLVCKLDDKKIEDYFKRREYRIIAIYGVNNIGELLIKELSASNVKVAYGIDRNAKDIESSINVIEPQENAPEKVDAVVVTAAYDFDQIEENLSEKYKCPIVSIEDVVDDMNYWEKE